MIFSIAVNAVAPKNLAHENHLLTLREIEM